MRTSESIATLAPALLKAQRLIGGTVKDKVGKILTKSGGSYEYNYSDLSSVLDAIKAPLNDNGLILLQSASADSTGVVVNTRLLHESGEWVEEALYMPVSVNTPQAFGSAITYCRRYGAQTICNLKAMDDDGAEASKPAPKAETRPNTATQVAVDAFDLLPADEQKFLMDQVTVILDMHKAGAEDIYQHIERQHFDTEEKLALWSRLPSNVRSTIKKQQPQHLGSQA